RLDIVVPALRFDRHALTSWIASCPRRRVVRISPAGQGGFIAGRGNESPGRKCLAAVVLAGFVAEDEDTQRIGGTRGDPTSGVSTGVLRKLFAMPWLRWYL